MTQLAQALHTARLSATLAALQAAAAEHGPLLLALHTGQPAPAPEVEVLAAPLASLPLAAEVGELLLAEGEPPALRLLFDPLPLIAQSGEATWARLHVAGQAAGLIGLSVGELGSGAALELGQTALYRGGSLSLAQALLQEG